jgi:hypothetical protein
MAFINDRIYDNGLVILDTEVNRLDMCSQEPATYAEAVETYTLANKLSPTIGAPAARSGGGREVQVDAITDGEVTGTGTASHWALVDTVNERLLAADELGASQVVTDGNVFTLAAFKIGFPGPA